MPNLIDFYVTFIIIAIMSIPIFAIGSVWSISFLVTISAILALVGGIGSLSVCLVALYKKHH